MKKFLAVFFLLLVPPLASAQGFLQWTTRPPGIATSVSSTAFPLLAPDGTAGAPSYSFAGDATTGIFSGGVGDIKISTGGSVRLRMLGTAGHGLDVFTVGEATTAVNAILATQTWNNAAVVFTGFRLNIINTASAVHSRLVDLQRGGTSQFTVTSGATSTGTQVRVSQQTAPTCSLNCGTSPSVSGADTAGTVTMGTGGAPASGWVVTFNGTWAAAPSCVVQMAKAGMVVGKMPLTVVTTTTTFTVVTNGTAPATTDMYHYQCIGPA